jgi:hypothetical protein
VPARWGYNDDIDIYDHRSVHDDLHRSAYKLLYHDHGGDDINSTARDDPAGHHHHDRGTDIDHYDDRPAHDDHLTRHDYVLVRRDDYDNLVAFINEYNDNARPHHDHHVVFDLYNAARNLVHHVKHDHVDQHDIDVAADEYEHKYFDADDYSP